MRMAGGRHDDIEGVSPDTITSDTPERPAPKGLEKHPKPPASDTHETAPDHRIGGAHFAQSAAAKRARIPGVMCG